MKIVELKVENVKRLRAVSISPNGNVVEITGRNGQGKSSVLDSITYALGGKDAICSMPLRNGEKKAKIVCRLDDLVITRTFTADGGGCLTVTNATGLKFPTPQAVLDRLVGKLTLDPLEFSRMDGKRQLETLKALLGLDFSAMDRERAEVYAERTIINRSEKVVSAQVDGLAEHKGVPNVETSLAELIEERDRRASCNAERERIERNTQEIEAKIEKNAQLYDRTTGDLAKAEHEYATEKQRLADELENELRLVRARFEREIKNAAAKHEQEKASLTERQAGCDSEKAALEAELSQMSMVVPPPIESVDEITSMIGDCETINRKVRENIHRAELCRQARLLKKKADALTARMDAIDAERQRMLTEADFPIEGLSFDDSGVILNGIPFSQASSAEQLRASVAIGLSMNPKIRVLLIRDGSLLDSGGMKMLAELAEERDAQIWIERVDDSGNVGVVIEDGMVSPEMGSPTA